MSDTEAINKIDQQIDAAKDRIKEIDRKIASLESSRRAWKESLQKLGDERAAHLTTPLGI